MSKRNRSFAPARAASSRPGPDPGSPPRDPPLADWARDAAFRSLARQARLYPDFDLTILDRTIDALADRLSPLDVAFTHAIYDAAVRRWLTLEFLLQRHITQPIAELEPRLRAALLGAAAQLIFMDRVPAHAAINHAVEWAKRIIRPGAGSLANAVLRKLAADIPDSAARTRARFADRRDELPLAGGAALCLAAELLPDDSADRLCIATSHPRALLDHWTRSRSLAEARSLCLHSLYAPPIILNTAYARDPVPANLTAPHQLPGHALLTGSAGPRLGSFLAARDDLWVQDPAASAAVESVADLKPRLVLDLCAGQGTKTRQLAATFPSARIIATDVDPARLETLAQVFAGSPQVTILPEPRLRADFLAQADLILLDVPCSNTGVLARRPEARYRFDAKHLASLVSLQKQIIADAIPLLTESPRGRILYSTCSLEPQENHDQAAWTARWHRLAISRDRLTLPTAQPGEAPAAYTDGSYSALLG